MGSERTIAAIATAEAPGGIGIVRVSGRDAFLVAGQVFRPRNGGDISACKGYTAHLGAAYTLAGERLDDAIALVFRAPRSYTGEDVVEISCHGGLYILRRLLREILSAGAGMAGPGEFTRRAYLNGKLDLAQAEAVMDLISASGEQAARAAQAASSGVLSGRIGSLRGSLQGIAAHLAAWADFPEEDVPQVEPDALCLQLGECVENLDSLLSGFEQGRVFRQGVDAVICGRPNVGKSTLMNLLAGCGRSIVTPHAGTTRDIVEETVLVGGIPLRLADTAGLRDTEDPVERLGVEAARNRIQCAQLLLAVFDASRPLDREDVELMAKAASGRAIAVVNKMDLPLACDLRAIESVFARVVPVSASTGEGLPELERQVADALGTGGFDPAAGVLSTERQRREAEKARDALREAKSALLSGMTLDAVTVCVEDALNALFSLTGERAAEAVIDQVFSQFCVGK